MHIKSPFSYLPSITLQPVERDQKDRFKSLMAKHHYLGASPKISETLWYVATHSDQWVALLTFSAAALKCAARDQWIGWEYRHRFDRLKLLANNSRFLILPGWNLPNLGSRILSLCAKRISFDWQQHFGHPLLLLETFVDPKRYTGTVYRASNWIELGLTKGFKRIGQGYSAKPSSPKLIFVLPLQANSRKLLSCAILKPTYQKGETKMTMNAEQMRSLPEYFTTVIDPRRAHGCRHRISTVLAIASAATLCGMKGYKAIYGWANNLGQKARQRFRCRKEKGKYVIPSQFVIRDVLVRVDPIEVDQALQRWNEDQGLTDTCLAFDGKTMKNAIDENGRQTHIASVVGHESKATYTQKK
ncbi:MAG: DUF4338 domain-containing protein [Desulfovermiculus sp.]|nr:DUF4338 domain-containing protein [Desulfovermiculus sp.]